MLDNLDNAIKPYFLKDIIFSLKNKTYKKGKLINFRLSGCYIAFIINTEKKRETFEVPLPFALEEKNGQIVFDYRLETLAEQDFELLINLKSTSKIKNSKFYNTVLTINSLN